MNSLLLLSSVGWVLGFCEVTGGTFVIAVDEEVLLGAAHQEYKSGNYKQALQHCSLVHERNPQRTDALLLLGAIYYQVVPFDCLLWSLF
jgi:hypothetical protein